MYAMATPKKPDSLLLRPLCQPRVAQHEQSWARLRHGPKELQPGGHLLNQLAGGISWLHLSYRLHARTIRNSTNSLPSSSRNWTTLIQWLYMWSLQCPQRSLQTQSESTVIGERCTKYSARWFATVGGSVRGQAYVRPSLHNKSVWRRLRCVAHFHL